MKQSLAAVVLLIAASIVLADPPPPTPKGVTPATGPAEAPPAEEAAEQLTFAGVFIPADAVAIQLDLAAYGGSVEVIEAVTHGATVTKGQTILELKADDLAEQRDAARRALTLAEAQLRNAQAQAKLDAEIETFELATAERKVAESHEALRWFDEADGKNLQYGAELAIQSNLDSIADNEEELEQLRKMYKSEELTNATADIVVKRAIRQLERIKARQAVVEARSKKTLEYDYKVQRDAIADRIARAEQNLQRTRIAQELAQVQRATNLETKRIADDKAREALGELEADAALLEVKAPADGVLLYGQMQGEQWAAGDPTRFDTGTQFKPQGVLMTLLRPGSMQVEASVPEANRFDVEPGTSVEVTTPSIDESVVGTIVSIAPTPMQKGQKRFFKVVIEVDAPSNIAPASTANVTVSLTKATASAAGQLNCCPPAAAELIAAQTKGGPATRPFDPAAEPATRPADADDPYLQPVRRRDSIDEAISDAVAFLIADQNDDGSWGTGTETRGTEIYSMVPGSHDAFRVATTALATMALDEAGHRDTDAYRKAVRYLVEEGDARRDNSRIMYNTWAHTYALQALSRELQRTPDDAEMRAAANWQLEKLKSYEVYVGGWNYYDFEAGTQQPSMAPTSFGTASALGALHEAKAAGLDVPRELVDRAVRRLAEMRTPLGTYLYSGSLKYRPQMGANRERGAVGRTQACVWALGLYDHEHGDPADADQALTMLQKEHAWLNMGRKRPFPHEAWYQTSGYYYYYAMYHAGLLVEQLDGKHTEAVAEMVLPYQEADGSFWDYAMWDYHKPYGTAYAVMALTRLRDAG
ncbi:MAG: HlyD family efflux transporter periplasmic adaptor subunit [Planctomycetota bacterium]